MTAGDHSLPSSHHSAPPALHNHQKDRRGALIFVSCFVIMCIAFIVVPIVVPIIFVRNTAPEPIKPRFELQQVGVEHLNYSVVNGLMTTASISLAIRMVFSAENENEFSIKYGMSSFNITYRGVPLGRATLPGFYLDCVKRVQMTVTADRVNLDDAADFVRDASLNDWVELRVMGDANAYIVTVSGLGTSTTTIPVSIDCVIAISPRKQALICKLCGSDVLKFIYR
ncbi:hypothetical protein OSB04_030188 [Centaurea solstitialis]|uniref:Late embryogenesis abundant protein LEA-2 subgroup domain-containing protein n=1 Tax=Centaurea solstitialis TaxID=347529 RepID=A0AA38W3K6_9ASTR|nr:hypothetical protein OSB04_030188 [Centaurea solstitialis]